MRQQNTPSPGRPLGRRLPTTRPSPSCWLRWLWVWRHPGEQKEAFIVPPGSLNVGERNRAWYPLMCMHDILPPPPPPPCHTHTSGHAPPHFDFDITLISLGGILILLLAEDTLATSKGGQALLGNNCFIGHVRPFSSVHFFPSVNL